MLQESGNRGSPRAVSVSAADIMAMSGNAGSNVSGNGKVRVAKVV